MTNCLIINQLNRIVDGMIVLPGAASVKSDKGEQSVLFD